jgi:CRP-like cAMP-binding protein
MDLVMSNFVLAFNQIVTLTTELENDLKNRSQDKFYKKGAYLLEPGKVCRHLYYIDKGLVKTSFAMEDKEFIMRFFPQNSFLTILDSYISQTPSKYEIIALEPTVVTLILRSDIEELSKKHHSIEIFQKRLYGIAACNMMQRISEMLVENPSQRYHNFVLHNNAVLQRISLGDLASYLGITQVSLSRSRAKR